jgi:hypothetical protein
VESALLGLDGVKDAAVVAIGNQNGAQRLQAFIVATLPS